MAIEVHDPFMVGQVGYDLNLMKVMQRYNISYILKATNANSITMVFWEKDISEALLTELKGLYHKVTMKDAALVCAHGYQYYLSRFPGQRQPLHCSKAV